MTKKIKSIYENTMNLAGDATMTLSAEERNMICNALTKCAEKETDIIPLMLLMDRMAKGK